MALNDILSINLKIPGPWRMALETVLGSQDEESKGIIGGGALRALYMQTMLNLPARINDVDIFADCGKPRVPRIDKIKESLGEPIHFRSSTFMQNGLPKVRLDYLVEAAHFGGAPMLQINMEHQCPWADVEGYLLGSNLGINQIAYDGCHTFVTSLFLRDMAQRTITYNPWMQWDHDNLSRTTRKMNDLIQRPEFAGFKPQTAPVVHFPRAEGDFWDHLADRWQRGERD